MLRVLVPFVTPSRSVATTAMCEICGNAIGDVHRHIVEIGERGAMCACQACAILFAHADSGRQFRTVPERVMTDRSFGMTAQRWASLGIPVGVAFFYLDSLRAASIACYPGPAGLVDAPLDDEVWAAVARATPLAMELEPDVEALLVRGRPGQSDLSCHLIPISSAYELVGRLRSCWQGFTGGDAAQRAISEFFADIERRGGHP